MRTLRSKNTATRSESPKIEKRAQSQLDPGLEILMLAFGGFTSKARFPPMVSMYERCSLSIGWKVQSEIIQESVSYICS